MVNTVKRSIRILKMRPCMSDFLDHPTGFIFFHFQPFFAVGCTYGRRGQAIALVRSHH
ncbi:hypothetical protein LC608_18265 [Nostoc sp. XA010]|uniref:hypothetical protein n=1 Tax=Nostoc sp. XA010 TaxID=2780407 RepID=UPI001E2E5482|nr:hypothetical protein [Nostoc sp. XA010]MCC5658894.1 hypothetical protein [Nostoc sp. XA010]